MGFLDFELELHDVVVGVARSRPAPVADVLSRARIDRNRHVAEGALASIAAPHVRRYLDQSGAVTPSDGFVAGLMFALELSESSPDKLGPALHGTITALS